MKKSFLKLLNKISLAHGAHSKRDDGMCAMEAAAFIAGKPHTDHPPVRLPGDHEVHDRVE